MPLEAATITIANEDGPGEGLNDPTPVTPIGGNPATTLGEQRLYSIRRAAEIWAAKVESSVEIVLQANFDPLDCGPSSGTLGSSGAFTFFRDFLNAPIASTYYPVALANAYAGMDLDPGDPDIRAIFNSSIGSSGCLNSFRWYYGVDGNAPANNFDLFEVVLHELAHGLGFSTLVNLNTGQRPNNSNDAYMLHLENHSTGKLFPAMTDSERVAAMRDPGDLHWTGEEVVAESGFLTGGRHGSGHVEMYAPSTPQPGSSVSHFSTTLTPDELLEPFNTANFQRRLTTALLQDLGWTLLPDSPVIEPAGFSLVEEECPPANNAVDPGETVTLEIALRNVGNGVAEDVQASVVPSNGIVPLTESASYGTLAAGGEPVARPFRIVAAGPCGETLTVALALRSGVQSLGQITTPVRLGRSEVNSHSFSNTAIILIPGSGRSGPASPYPSTLVVSGVTQPVQRVTLTLHRLTHGFPDNLDALLLGPQGQSVLVMSDAGGGAAANQTTLTFDDTAASNLSDSGPLVTGVYRPSNFGSGDAFPSPAPSPPFGSQLNPFSGLNPNGTWRLFLYDDSNPNDGALNGGWTLTIHTEGESSCCDSAEFLANLAIGYSTPSNGSAFAANDPFTIRLSVTNLGPNVAVGVVVTNRWTGPMTLVSATPSQGSCTVRQQEVECRFSNLDPNQTAQLTLAVVSGSSGTIVHSASAVAASTDSVPGNNVASLALTVDDAPVVSAIANQIVPEDTPSGPIPFTVTDPDTPFELLTVQARSSVPSLIPDASIQLLGANRDRTIQFQSGLNQSGLGSIVITADDGLNVSTQRVLVSITAVNDAPAIQTVPDQTIAAGQTLLVTNKATDVDTPLGALRFALSQSPPNAQLDPITGQLTWLAPETLAGSVESFTVAVSDNGSPPLSDETSFHVEVTGPPRLLQIRLLHDEIELSWGSSPGTTYQVQSKLNLEEPNWSDLGSPIPAVETTTTATLPWINSQGFFQLIVQP